MCVCVTLAISKVNSPGPAAGAYWLERRQSYRVKMAAPQALISTNSDGGGRKQRVHHHHQQQRFRRPPSNTASASALTTLEADDRVRRKNRTPARGTSTPNNAVRPTTAAAITRGTPAPSSETGGPGGEKRR